jgi:hypothetical protein
VIRTVTNVTENDEAAQRWRTGPVAVTGPRLLGHVVPTLTPELVDVMLASTVLAAAAASTARRFGVEFHRVGDVWRPQ